MHTSSLLSASFVISSKKLSWFVMHGFHFGNLHTKILNILFAWKIWAVYQNRNVPLVFLDSCHNAMSNI